MYKKLIDKLSEENMLSDDDMLVLLNELRKTDNNELREYLYNTAFNIKKKYYGDNVYSRGLIEFSNICRNNCLYCGIRHANKEVNRYRLSKDDIIFCAKNGYELGFRTIVLQSGEDAGFKDELLGEIVTEIKKLFPDIAITLSVGEREKDTYKYWFDCGAERYLLRHETATKEHYEKLHPSEMSFEHRIKCLYDLKDIGYQVGAGFMVGSPYQETKHLVNDLKFLYEFQPQMVGIGPFIPQKDSPFHEKKAGTLTDTLIMLSLVRIVLKDVLLPATTALGTIDPTGREKGILSGANVVMPNLSPVTVRKDYALYDNKICTGDESAQCVNCLGNRLKKINQKLVISRGDHPDFIK